MPVPNKKRKPESLRADLLKPWKATANLVNGFLAFTAGFGIIEAVQHFGARYYGEAFHAELPKWFHKFLTTSFCFVAVCLAMTFCAVHVMELWHYLKSQSKKSDHQ